jgi:hypothetical protein
LADYYHLVLKKGFIGAQPETLHGKHLPNLYKTKYAVTKKLDGERCLVFIDKNGRISSINSNATFSCVTDLESLIFTHTIIDAERVKNDTHVTFHCFDIIFYNGVDLRGDSKLQERLDLLSSVVLTIEPSKYFRLVVKDYIFKNIFTASKLLMEDPEGCDGLIFVPIDETYPTTTKCPNLYKWKPVEFNTIDLYSVNTEGDNWELYVTTKPIHKISVSSSSPKMLFDVEAISGIKTMVDTFKTTFPVDLIDTSTGVVYQTNTVIEYRFDTKACKFVPIRTRWDKTMNPKKHGNFVSVALDIWSNILNPVTLDTLSKLVVFESVSHYKNMRYCNNRVKEMLYGTYTKEGDFILELCCGKGGDTNKWRQSCTVHGYDRDSSSINECNSRSKNSKNVFRQLDLSTKECSQEIRRNAKDKLFDTSFCHFAIHYFLSSKSTLDNFINILNVNLKVGGTFTISFMDSVKLSELFNGKRDVYSCIDREIMYTLSKGNENKECLYGNALNITLNGNNVVSNGSNEYQVNHLLLVEYMKTNGYDLMESKLFS